MYLYLLAHIGEIGERSLQTLPACGVAKKRYWARSNCLEFACEIGSGKVLLPAVI
jgi:hypothetical protein